MHFNIPGRMMTALIAASLATPAVADDAGRPKEIERVYAYQGKDMKAYGGEVNADIARLAQLFAVAPESRAGDMPPGAGEEKGWLGIAMNPVALQAKEPGAAPQQAVEAAKVMPGSPAETAGLRAGDLIVALDGAPVENRGDQTLPAFRMAISGKRPGEKLKLQILRGNTPLELEATLKAYPRADPVLKPHADLEQQVQGNGKPLLNELLEKEGLAGEFARLAGELRNETDRVDSPLIRNEGYNPFRLQEVNYIMYNPLDLPMVSRKLTDRLHGSYGRTRHDLAALLRTAMDELDMTALPAVQAGKPPADLAGYIGRLVTAIRHANAERAAVLSVLDAEELEFLYANVPELLGGNPEPDNREQTEAEEQAGEARLLRIFQLVMRLDLPRLLNASVEVAQALDIDALMSLDKSAAKLARYPKGWIVHRENNLTVIDTPAGRVLIGGGQRNTYTEDAALILDFGGNDSYLNHAGGSTRNYPFSVVIDLSGDDTYSTSDDFAQGAGLLGGGFLIDLAGDDRYTAKHHAQGAGILGVGMLADLAGSDQYTAVSMSQGAANFGVGMLAEGGGNDRYSGNYFVQGAGYIKGFGAIVEVAGNDDYSAGGLYEDFRAPEKSYQSMSQGYGYGMRPSEFIEASGGIGVIAEAEGNDTYVADYFAQGSSYWFALGILDDRKGHDRYISGRYSQGAGIHMSAGVLLDGEGDDNYLADFGVAQGCGHDYGIGFLLDNGGNDRYIAGTIAQGAGNNNGIGVLSDNGGDDEYYLKSLGQGRGNFEPARDLGSFGLLFDTGGGNDTYTQGGRNDSLNYKTQWGILLDTH
ncbi:MAG: PDZ domain-containing protein [Nitrosomonadales bacterium]|nr:PDZ domain-containing protein [Nitrosomonadales bacterium]